MHENIQHYPEATPELLAAYQARFFIRQDLYAVQCRDGHYVSKRLPVTPDLTYAHLVGKVTLGTYCLRPDNTTLWVVIDADTEDIWQKLTALARTAEIPIYLEQSRRGGHAWCFFAQAELGRDVRQFARALTLRQKIEKVEVYPKQDELVDGPGSLIRAPFGFHRKVQVLGQAGKRYGFQTPDGESLAPTIREQVVLLIAAETISHALLSQIIATLPAPEPIKTPSLAFTVRPTSAELPLSARIKTSIGVEAFVRQYVPLDEHGRGFCPFHHDEHPSFGVNVKHNYWSCYAGCGGGSIIDFWMLWRATQGQDSSFRATLAELAGLLGIPSTRRIPT